MTLRNALTPKPRYIRARPASIGLGLEGSGPSGNNERRKKLRLKSHLPRTSRCKVSETVLGGVPASARCCIFVLTTSRGYMRAQLETPAKEPQTNGIRDACIGSHEGVRPCSPERLRPSRCRIASYSKKYRAVPQVSRTGWWGSTLIGRYAGKNYSPKWRRKPV